MKISVEDGAQDLLDRFSIGAAVQPLCKAIRARCS